MQYPDGQVAHRGDKVRLWSGTVGTVVCSLDTDAFSDEYPRHEWNYLRRGVLIHSIQTGVLSENFIRSGIGLLRSNRRIITSDVFCPLGFRQLRR